jgi:DNA-directed RNA polymerase I, II, and III subunit RPABC1
MDGPNDQEKTNIYKVRKTVLQMLKDRGYIVSENDLLESLEDYKNKGKTSKDLTLIVSKRDDSADQLYVEYSENAKLGVVDISNFAETLHKEGVKTGIIINRGAITPLAKMVRDAFI